MLGSSVLDVLVGLVATYALLGAVSACVTHAISRWGWAERNLVDELNATFGDQWSKAMRGAPICVRRPLLNVPAGAFVVALLGEVTEWSKPASAAAEPSGAVLYVIGAADDDQVRLRAGLEALVLSTMNRAWRHSRQMALAVALGIVVLLSVSLDIDTLTLGTAFWQEQAVRAAITGAVQAASGNGLEDAFNFLAQNDPVIGWQNPPETNSEWILKAIGLLLTSMAGWGAALLAGDVYAMLTRHRQDATSAQTEREADRWDAMLGLRSPDSP
jgi:hypothetical protein